MPAAPEVSIVIPTRDRWSLLQAAIGAALRQEEVEFEVIVVDDGSRDETPARLGEIEDARLRILRNDESLGVARARNRGLAEARGTWTAFLDDDDVWSPRKLRAQLDAAAGASFVYGSTLLLDRTRTPVRALPAPDPSSLARRLLLTNPIGGPSTFMARTELLRRLGGFDERLSALADWDLLIRLAGAGRGAACREFLVGYVQHGENMLAPDDDRSLGELDYLAAKHGESAKAAGVPFGAVWRSRWIALQHRRAGRRFRAAAALARGALAARSFDNLVRAVGALAGEGVMRWGQRKRAGPPVSPDWLDKYR